jgi:Domain of unknown function (DUF397)
VDLSGAEWRKSSYSGNNGGECVEVARLMNREVAVRDSKDSEGPAVAFADESWAKFTDRTKRSGPGL